MCSPYTQDHGSDLLEYKFACSCWLIQKYHMWEGPWSGLWSRNLMLSFTAVIVHISPTKQPNWLQEVSILTPQPIDGYMWAHRMQTSGLESGVVTFCTFVIFWPSWLKKTCHGPLPSHGSLSPHPAPLGRGSKIIDIGWKTFRQGPTWATVMQKSSIGRQFKNAKWGQIRPIFGKFHKVHYLPMEVGNSTLDSFEENQK